MWSIENEIVKADTITADKCVAKIFKKNIDRIHPSPKILKPFP